MVREPATIFVLWHPSYAAGQEIATSIFKWFRTPAGHGIPVVYRCEPDPKGNTGLPPRIEFPGNRLTILVMLAETQIAKDYRWRDWLTELANAAKGRSVIIYPVALEHTAYKLPGPIRELNFISSMPSHGRRASTTARWPWAGAATGRARLRLQNASALDRWNAPTRQRSCSP